MSMAYKFREGEAPAEPNVVRKSRLLRSLALPFDPQAITLGFCVRRFPTCPASPKVFPHVAGRLEQGFGVPGRRAILEVLRSSSGSCRVPHEIRVTRSP